MCRLTGNTKLGKNRFSSAKATIEWGKEVKKIITKAVTATTQQKDNEYAHALTEM